VKKLFLSKYWIFLNFLRLGDPKLRDLANKYVFLQINYDIINFNNINYDVDLVTS